MEGFWKSLCCIIPWFKRRNEEKCIQKKIISQCPVQRVKKALCPQTGEDYVQKRRRILAGITFDYSKIIVIWGYTDNLPKEKIMDLLAEYGEIKNVQNRWVVSHSGERLWRGALVEFTTKGDAKRAATDLHKHVKYIRTTVLESVINTIADCELLYLDNPVRTTKILIKRKGPLRISEAEALHKNLNTYGLVASLFLNNRLTKSGTVCEVSYMNVTQAYLAMIMTNGLVFCGEVLTTVMEKTEKEQYVLQDAKDSIILLSNCVFPC